MSARSKKPSKPPVRPPDEDAKTTVFDSGNFKKETSTPIEVISMKTPASVEVESQLQKTPALKRPRLRAISEVTPLPHAQPANLGYLAPPRDPAEVRARRLRDFVIWGSVCVIIACGVALAIWFLAGR